MYEAVTRRALPTVLVELEGKGHGFRHAENICHALEGERPFSGQIFGFVPANVMPTLNLQNIARWATAQFKGQGLGGSPVIRDPASHGDNSGPIQ